MDKRKRFELLLLGAVFTIATCGLIYELVAGALASYLLGDSVKQFSFIIGVYLFAMGIGSYLAKFLTGNLLRIFIDIEILIGLVGGLSSVVLFLLFEQVDFFQFVLYLFVFVTGCLVGLEIPLLMNILKDRMAFKDLVSNVFTFDYIGALLASILFPLFLVPKLGIMGTSLFFGLINISIAWLLCRLLRHELPKRYWLEGKAIASFLILLTCFIFTDYIQAFTENKLYGENIIISKNTRYQRMVLTHKNDDYRLYLNNNLQFSSADEYRYHESLVHPALSLAKDVSDVLILGGGDGMAVREILKYPQVKSITLIDLDQQLTTAFQQNDVLKKLNHNSLNHPKVRVFNADAYQWIKTNTKKYGVVIIDFPDPSNYSIGKLYALNFYDELQKRLLPNALVAVQSTSPYFAPKSFWCIHQTIKAILPHAQAYQTYVPSFGAWGFTLASAQPFQNFAVRRKVEKLRFYNYKFTDLTSFSRDMLAPEVEVNKLNNQILVRYFDEEWGNVQ
ncbi:polyamine aminopropyltransferase [Flavobacterium aurantiibacter]|uniref:Polyamine aminopropyltransferase n=1 Tax=Flavobacterium aurantiibacter TaxID=2023067 RepID=A0A256A0X3_9FLAO|nr:polyamine aminopropyltransferase [Flavobacterium aurantiibacter]OYQ46775.1 spermidine synthase [Flavobacterium aurantiibacter]